MNPSVNEKIADKWLSRAVDALTHVGYFVLEGVLDERMIEATREALLGTQRKIVEEVGRERLDRAGELGVLRLMMKYDPHFYDFLAIPEMLAALDTYLAPTAVLHTQNGFVLPSLSANETPRIFQNMYHQDFPRSLDGYLASLNTMFAISEFTAKSGATYVVPGSHQSRERPSNEYLEASGIPIECPAGSMILFDSTLYHAAGFNCSGSDRFAVNHQFTRSFFKQQMDYSHALDEAVIAQLPARSQQLLGWYTRVPKSLDEYYQPKEQRLYRAGQG